MHHRKLLIFFLYQALVCSTALAQPKAASPPNPPPQICINNKCVTAGGTSTVAGSINWNPGLYLLSYTQPLKNSFTYSGSTNAADIANADACKPTCVGYAFFAEWSFFEGGSSGTQGDYSNVANNGTSNMAQIMSAASKDGLHVVVQFNPGIFSGGAKNYPTDGSKIPAYVLTNSGFGAANVGSSGTPVQSPYAHGWYEQQTGGYGAAWMDGNGGVSTVGSAMLASIKNFAEQWDGNPNLEAFCMDADTDMYPYNDTGLQGSNYYASLTVVMQAIKSYFKHTNVCLQVAGEQGNQQYVETLVRGGVLVSNSDTAGATAWNATYRPMSLSAINSSTTGTFNYPLWGNTYTCVTSTGQTVQMISGSGAGQDVTFSPPLTGSPSLNLTCNYAWAGLGPSMQAWANIQAPNTAWTPPNPSLQSYSTSMMFAEEGDFSDPFGTGLVFPTGFTAADMVNACNDKVVGGVGYHCSHLMMSYSNATTWANRLQSYKSAGGLTNTGYPSVYTQN